MLTYLDFLILFIFLPTFGVIILNLYELKRKNPINTVFKGINPVLVLFFSSFIALFYTTPWDNYLVANEVWFYELDQILGVIIGFVPLEEYIFFFTQPFFVGSILIWELRYYQPSSNLSRTSYMSRILSIIPLFIIWIISLVIFLSNFSSGRYLALIILWAFPPIMLQLGYGADILWNNWKLILPTIVLPSLYLSIADAFAISDGVWTIAPETSLGVLFGGILPFEEILFFFVTNILIVFGMTLLMDVRSRKRGESIMYFLKNSIHKIKSKNL